MKRIIIFENINYILYFKYLILYSILNKKENFEFLYIYSAVSLKLLSLVFKNYSNKIKKFEFNFYELKFNNSQNAYLDATLKDFHIIFQDILNDYNLNNIKNNKDLDYFNIFLKKKIFTTYEVESQKTLLLIHAVYIKIKIPNKDSKLTLVLEKRFWGKQLKKYFTKKIDIDFIFYNNFNYIKDNIKTYIKITPLYIFYLLFRFYRLRLTRLIDKKNIIFSSFDTSKFQIIIDTPIDFVTKSKFWNEKIINSKNAIFVSRFSFSGVEKIIRKKNQLDLDFFTLSSEFNFTFIDNFKFNLKFLNELLNPCLFEIKNEYEHEKIIWKKTFKKFNSKIYITSNKWDPGTVAACSAISDFKGISIYYQTSYFEIPSGNSNIKADIYFSFSNKLNNLEKFTGSQISYNISCGYIGDHIFKSVKEKSINLRNKLKQHGCKKIIALFDQEYIEDKRWFYDQDYYQDLYIFWLKKIIEEPWLGLIIKQKKPGSMFLEPNNPYKLVKGFERLQPLLNEVLSTGRCFFYLNRDEFSVKNHNATVAEAAMSADISIATMLYTGTAGIESALAGTPTLYYDDLNHKNSQMYRLGKNKVVFDNWDIMWEKIQGYFNDQYVIGDWSKILDDIDPFRDGKTSYRINQFLIWLQEGYKKNNNKEDIIRYAVKKYSDIWGTDKIIKN